MEYICKAIEKLDCPKFIQSESWFFWIVAFTIVLMFVHVVASTTALYTKGTCPEPVSSKDWYNNIIPSIKKYSNSFASSISMASGPLIIILCCFIAIYTTLFITNGKILKYTRG